MRLQRLLLRDFRNFAQAELQPHPRINVFTGTNGQGKTTILEAVSYLSTLRSFRGARTEEVVRFGQGHGEIRGWISPDPQEGESEGAWQSEFKVVFSSQQLGLGESRWVKAAFINGKPFRSSAAYLKQRFGNWELGFHTVVFNPSDHDLVKGEPAIRRRYLDLALAAENPRLLEAHQRYQKLLVQRNALLKQARVGGPSAASYDHLRDFTEPMARLAAELTLGRLEWLGRMLPKARIKLQRIAPNQLDLGVFFQSNWVPDLPDFFRENRTLAAVHFTGQERQASLELLEQAYWTKSSALEQAEFKAGSTLVGPHRDDWAFTIGSHPLKGHGSQGEVRSTLLSLKLSEIELFQESTGHQPLFLLDDFSSELDRERRSYLLEYLQSTDLQVFVTTTEESVFEPAIQEGRHFVVSEGTVTATRDFAPVRETEKF